MEKKTKPNRSDLYWLWTVLFVLGGVMYGPGALGVVFLIGLAFFMGITYAEDKTPEDDHPYTSIDTWRAAFKRGAGGQGPSA